MGVCLPHGAASQQADSGAAIIDTVIVVVENVFPDEEAGSSLLARSMNRFRFPTRPGVVQARLLFGPGDPYDSTEIAESTRRIRELAIFQEVAIDSGRLQGRLAVTVRVRDSWSTSPQFSLSAGGGTTTWALGVTESNLLGTGNLVHLSYAQEVDRTSADLSGQFERVIGDIDLDGIVRLQSDGRIADWRIGSPFRSGKDRSSFVWESEVANQRVLQFRTATGVPLDTTIYQRGGALGRVSAAGAPMARVNGFVRVGAKFQIRQERYVLQSVADQIDVPDTVTAAVGASVEWRRSRYRTYRHFNGFGSEGIDLSHSISFTAWVAPSFFGYQSTGVGPEIALQAATGAPFGFIGGAITANGLFTAAGLDSGQVEVSVTAGLKPATRHATALHIRAGALESTQPGREFDLGFDTALRSWGPHSFVGTRTAWGILEHRWFVVDNLLDLIGLGVAGFLEYGGAWYADQPQRFGGNAGVGIRFGSAVGALPRTGRIDLGYRFGNGVSGDRWVVSLGGGFVFGASGDPTCVPQTYEVADICRSRR